MSEEEKDQILQDLDNAGSEILVADLTDLPRLVSISETFKRVAQSVGEDFPRVASSAQTCGWVLERIVLDERDNPEQDIDRIGAGITEMRSVVEGSQNDQDASYPDEIASLMDVENATGTAENGTGSDQEQSGSDEQGTDTPDKESAEQASSEQPETSSDEIENGEGEESAPQGSDDIEGLVDRDHLLQSVQISDPDLVGEFINEAQEHFDTADESLLILENNAGDEEAISAVFRAFHTIKGTSGFMGLTPISELAHKAENLLDEVRHGRISLTGDVADASFSALDTLKQLVSDLSEALSSDSSFTPSEQVVSTTGQLVQLLQKAGEAEGKEESGAAAVSTGAAAWKEESGEKSSAGAPGSKGGEEDNTAGEGGAQRESGDEQRDAGSTSQGSASGGNNAVRQTMKIDAEKIDNLLDTIGELVIVESIVTDHEDLANVKSPRLQRNLSQLSKITRSLQDMAMSMRMVPIDATFRKMSRLVRDLARKAGKEIELSVTGKEAEIDKGMVEKLNDPLVHMVRNSVDHGIEDTPEEREQAGKPREGHVQLNAFHEGGSIHIQISDDGKGLDREAIAQRAKERGVVSETESMSDEDVFSLIFEPGFSTAQQVTDVSGRGVGMDVVKSNIENMRGNVRIESEKGKGTTFTLVLPLTMAIIDGMHCKVGSEQYIIPLLSIIQSFQPTVDMISTVAGRGEMVPFRGNLVPLFRISELFHTEDAKQDPTEAIAVVVEDAGRRAALLVDELLGQNQTVIKSLGDGLGEVPGLAGATILSDGSPGLIIDIHGVVNMATGRAQQETAGV